MTRITGALIVLAQLVAVAATIFGSILFASWVASTPAKAQDEEAYRWVTKRVAHRVCDWGDCRVYYTYARVRRYVAPVYGYVRRDEDDQRGRSCKDVRRAVGDQHLTVDGAKKAAGDAWAGAVRFHYGEKWMALDNARNVDYVCSRSSIKEGGVTTLGQTLNRCEITATPCQPSRERDER